MRSLAIAIAIQLMFFSTDYAQGISSNAEKVELKVVELLAQAEQHKLWPLKLNPILVDLREELVKHEVGLEARRAAAIRLIKIYDSLDNSAMNIANKKRILDAIGRSDNSPEAHVFFLKALDSENEEIRKAALWSLTPRGLHGDDVYEKIKILEKNGILTTVAALINLGKANPHRAIKEMKEFLSTTKSLKKFIVISLNLPEGYYNDPNTLDVIIERYYEFKATPSQDLESAGYTPDRAISSKDVWKYVDARDGKRLQIALDILKDKGVCGDSNLPQLQKKLSSRDSLTREKVVDFMEFQVSNGNLNKKIVHQIIEGARNTETVPGLKRKMEIALQKIEREGTK